MCIVSFTLTHVIKCSIHFNSTHVNWQLKKNNNRNKQSKHALLKHMRAKQLKDLNVLLAYANSMFTQYNELWGGKL